MDLGQLSLDCRYTSSLSCQYNKIRDIIIELEEEKLFNKKNCSLLTLVELLVQMLLRKVGLQKLGIKFNFLRLSLRNLDRLNNPHSLVW